MQIIHSTLLLPCTFFDYLIQNLIKPKSLIEFGRSNRHRSCTKHNATKEKICSSTLTTSSETIRSNPSHHIASHRYRTDHDELVSFRRYGVTEQNAPNAAVQVFRRCRCGRSGPAHLLFHQFHWFIYWTQCQWRYRR